MELKVVICDASCELEEAAELTVEVNAARPVAKAVERAAVVVAAVVVASVVELA